MAKAIGGCEPNIPDEGWLLVGAAPEEPEFVDEPVTDILEVVDEDALLEVPEPKFGSADKVTQDAPELAPVLPGVYGRYETRPVLSSCMMLVGPPKYVALASLLGGPARD